MSCGICNYSYTDCECTEDMHRAYNSGIEAGEAISSDTIAHLTAELAEAREKLGLAYETAAKVADDIAKDYDVMEPGRPDRYASLKTQRAAKGMVRMVRDDIRALDPDATAALAARDKRVREEAFRNGHSRGRTRNIVNEDEDVANYLARLDQHK